MYEEGEYFAKYHKIKFIETSAISGENVQVNNKSVCSFQSLHLLFVQLFLSQKFLKSFNLPLIIQEAFVMLAREINNRIEDGSLQIIEGWEGIKSGVTMTLSLSEESSRIPSPSSCSC